MSQADEDQPTPELVERRNSVMADVVAAAGERNELIEKERKRRRKEDRYVKRTLETTVCKMLEVLQTNRGKVILDQEALEIQKRRFKVLSSINPEAFVVDVDLRNFVLVKLFQLYDISKSSSISRSDFVGIVERGMGITVKDSDIDRMYNAGVAADFEAVSEFVQWKVAQMSKRQSDKFLTRIQTLKKAARKSIRSVPTSAEPTKEDFRIAQKMILEKLKLDTGKQARLKFRQRHPVLIALPDEDGADGFASRSRTSGFWTAQSPALLSAYERGSTSRDLAAAAAEEDDAAWEARQMAEERIKRSEWLMIQQEQTNKKGKKVKVWFKRPVFTQLVGQALYPVDVSSHKKSFDLKQCNATLQLGTSIVNEGNLSRLIHEAHTRDDLNWSISLNVKDGKAGSRLFLRAPSIGIKIDWIRALFAALHGLVEDTIDLEAESEEPPPASPSAKSSSKLSFLWKNSQAYAVQGVLIKLPTSMKTTEAEKVLAKAAEVGSFFAVDRLPRGAEYRFFALRGTLLSYYDFKWAFQSIVPQHGLDERCMLLGPGCKILVDSAKKSAQASQQDAKVSNPDVAAALETGCTFTIVSPPVFLTFASPSKANGHKWLSELSRASLAVSGAEVSESEKVEMLFQGWFLKKGQNKNDKWRPRFFVYWTSGIVQYFESGGDNSNDKPLGEINIARDAKEIRWSTDALIDKKSFPSPHCIEIVTKGRVWQLCPIESSKAAESRGSPTNPAKVLTRFMRLLESNVDRHKATFNRKRLSVSESDRQYIPQGENLTLRTGHGMTAWQRISGNVPSSYVSYAEIKLIRLVSSAAVAATSEDAVAQGLPLPSIDDDESGAEDGDEQEALSAAEDTAESKNEGHGGETSENR